MKRVGLYFKLKETEEENLEGEEVDVKLSKYNKKKTNKDNRGLIKSRLKKLRTKG